VRRRAAVGALALVLVPTASGTESTIYPGVGIGKVKLGMSAAQVRKALGRDYLVGRRSTVGGVHYVEYEWDFANWTVTFSQRGRSLRAVQIGTTLRSQRTSKGVGRGTSWPRLVHTYPGGQCGWGNPHFSAIGFYLEYLVARRGGSQTLYLLEGVYSKALGKIVRYRVLAVLVRTPYEPIDGFGANRSYRCSDGWQNATVPLNVPIR